MQSPTLNIIKDWIEAECLNHPKIESFLWEEKAEDNTELRYPNAFAFTDSGASQSGVVMTLPISIAFRDLVKKDNGNKFEVSSDMLEVAKNILADLRNENDLFILDETSINFRDFYDSEYDTEAAGWVLGFVIKIANPFNSCYVESEVPDNALIDLDGNILIDQDGNTLIYA